MSAKAAVTGSRSLDPAPPLSLWRTPRTRSLLALTLLALIGGALDLTARVYTDFLWYREVDQVGVLWTTLRWKILAGALPALGTACFVLLNLAAVGHAMEHSIGRADDSGLAATLWERRAIVQPAVVIACGVLAFRMRSPDSWRVLLLWSHGGSFGVRDPLFHRDVGFFVFDLPLYREVARWLVRATLMAGVASLATYFAAGLFQSGQRRAAIRGARAHLLTLAAVLLGVLAWRFQLDQFVLALPHDPVAPGASYSDVSVRLPALRVLSPLALGGAGVCLYARRHRVPTAAAVALVLVGALAVLAKSELPATVQRFGVEPQALARERPHVSDAIAFTRRAYGLDRVSVRPLAPGSTLTRSEVGAEARAVANVPLWDASVLKPAMNDLQSIGSYYAFPSVTTSRYTVDGRSQVMTVGARELAPQQLSPGDRSWANVRFAYTHGYGLVAVHGGDADQGRYPRFAQQEFGGHANPLGVRQPRLYYGEQAGDDPPYVVVNSGRGEVDEPISGDRSSNYHYDGPGGIAISSRLRRIAFAARFADLDLLLSQTVTPRSRIVLHRDVGARLRALAPFLRWDRRPQTIVVDGSVQFLFDGYTTSTAYPYSAQVRVGGKKIDYIHEAAHATIDAFTGRVRIYAAADADPILRAWEAAYPGLIRPPAQMPAGMRAHLRYPRELFEAQADVYASYHAADPTAFWNGEDAWARAREIAGPVEQASRVHFPSRSGPQMRSAYVLSRLPGDRRERFMLVTPFTPASRQNLVSYLSGSLDAQGRPRLALLSLPRDRLMLGPTQATRRILASSGVARLLELLNRESSDLGKAAVSRTTLGAPRLVPLGDTLVHVQPVFLTAGGSGVPRLQLVTAFANGRVGYGRTLAAALRLVATQSCSAPPALRPQRCR